MSALRRVALLVWVVTMGFFAPGLALGGPSLSDADPAFADPVSPLLPRLKVMQGESSLVVEITAAKGEKVVSHDARAVGDRIEVALEGVSITPETLAITDELAKRVDLLGGRKPRLSVQLRHGKTTTAKIAGATQIVATGSGLRVVVPRKEFAVAQPVKAVAPLVAAAETGQTIGLPSAPAPTPAPTVAPTLAPTVAAPAAPTPATSPKSTEAAPATLTHPPLVAATPGTSPAAAAPPELQAPVAPVKVETAVESGAVPVAPVAASSPIAAETSPHAPAFPLAITAPAIPTKALVSQTSGAGIAQILLFFLFIAGCGIAVFWARRRGKTQSLGQSIRVLSSRSLGPRTRLVLVGAGRRTFLLSVGDKGARVLCRWAKGSKRAEKATEADFFAAGDAMTADEPADLTEVPARGSRASWKAIMEQEVNREPEADEPARTVKESPLISGLLKLRGARTGAVKNPLATADTMALDMSERVIHGRRNGALAR
jgi:flagellar biogenesis protein FliO